MFHQYFKFSASVGSPGLRVIGNISTGGLVIKYVTALATLKDSLKRNVKLCGDIPSSSDVNTGTGGLLAS